MNHSTSTNNNKGEAEHRQANSYKCPKCGSNRVGIGYPNIRCFSCGWSEPLIDFPVSWGWHRYYSVRYSGHDPGPCEAPEHTLEELHDHLANIEERLAGLSEEEQRHLGLKLIWDEVKQLRLGLRHTQRLIPRVLPKRKPLPPKLGKGVEL